MVHHFKGQKATPNLWYVDTRPNSQKLKVCHIWLEKFKKKLCLVIFFIHIIQLSLFCSEYLPKAVKKVNNHCLKGRFELWLKNITEHQLFFEFYKPNKTRPSKAWEQFLWIWPGIDVPKIHKVPLFDPKVHLFENSLLKILAQLQMCVLHRLCCLNFNRLCCLNFSLQELLYWKVRVLI